MKPIRLQSFLAQAGLCSRRAAEELIKSGVVSVDDEIALLGSSVTPDQSRVLVSGKPVTIVKKCIYLLHKPTGYVTSMGDPQGRESILNLLSKHKSLIQERVFPVGRLDYDVSGLLILTNDGDYANLLLHPSHEAPRRYHALVSGVMTGQTIKLLKRGVAIDANAMGKVTHLSVLESSSYIKATVPLRDGRRGWGARTLVEVEVREGRKHFVKNIFKNVGHPVESLVRVGHGPYSLGSLKSGEVRKVEFIAISAIPVR